jgi:hypothetical protein
MRPPQDDGDNDGGTEGINASHPNQAQVANTATACLNAVEYHLSGQLRPLGSPMIQFYLITRQQTLHS